jgi:FKBP-type peptidyl-prolyl cis-trans isomerase SlyD
MIENDNKFMTVTYHLYAEVNGENELLESTPENDPFQFVTGMGITLPLFEESLKDLPTGASFDFVIPKDDAYGDFVEEHVVPLDKKIFEQNGKIDEQLIYEGAIVPLVNEDGNRFNGRITAIDDKKVTVDLNHPYAGLDLHFVGKVVESRLATEDEMKQIAKMLSGEGCGGCSGCSDGSGCGDGGCSDGGCGGCRN